MQSCCVLCDGDEDRRGNSAFSALTARCEETSDGSGRGERDGQAGGGERTGRILKNPGTKTPGIFAWGPRGTGPRGAGCGIILILFKKAKCLFIAPKARSGSHETV